MDLKQWATANVQSLSPSNRAKHCFAYYGDLPLGETWGSLIGEHRDSDVLQRSNFRAIVADMQSRFPEDCAVESATHWAVGWSEELYVRLLEDNGEPTEAAAAAMEWADKLENYPVADESDYYELELEEEETNWDSWGRREWEEALSKTFGADLDIPADKLDLLAAEYLEYPEHDGDGSPIWRFEPAARAAIEAEDLSEYTDPQDLLYRDLAEDAALPPYKREGEASIKARHQADLPPYLRD